MKPLGRLILLLALAAPVLSGCGLTAKAGPMDLDSLAHRVPGDMDQVFFLDLRPTGEAGRYWERIRKHLEANSDAQEMVDSLLGAFPMQDLGVDPFVVGPAVSGYLDNNTVYTILQVKSLAAARDAVLLQDPHNLDWEREEYQGKSLYHHRAGYVYGRPQWRAFAAYDGLMLVTTSYVQDPIDDLKMLVGLPRSQSLASLPSWKTLRTRLPASPMGLIFINTGEPTPADSPPAGDPSPSTALAQQIEAVALAAVPEEDGMRVEIAGDLALQDDVLPVIQRLLQLPGVDPGSWDSLPANTAIALSTHDASTVWPVLSDILPLQGLASVRNAIGLDLEADLMGSNGPFPGDLAVAITPPLVDQPISQGLTAGQLLFVARGTSQDQAAALQATMESRGAILGSQTVNGVELTVQAGTEAMGYAVSFGFDDDLFVLGTSPGIVDQGVSARRAGNGLAADPIFQTVLAKMQDPSFFLYLNTRSLSDLAQANMTAEQYEQSAEISSLGAFDAVGLGLRLDTEEIGGTLYFLISD